MPRRPPIVQERVLPAPPAAVFAAWSDPRSMACWMHPGADLERVSVELDFRVGGRFRIVMHGEQDWVHSGEYLAIQRDRRICFTWVSEFLPAPVATTRVTVTFEPVDGDRTRIRLSHDLLPDHEAYDRHPDGWGRILSTLARHLATTHHGGDPS